MITSLPSITSSKLNDLKARFELEKRQSSKIDEGSSESSNPFGGSRPGSVRRPNQLGDVKTPTGTKLQKLGLQFAQQTPVKSHKNDAIALEQKMKEIMKINGVVSINGQKYNTSIDEMEHLGELGQGTCGHVVKMLHKPSQTVLAVKQMRRSGNLEESWRIATDLEVVLMSHDCQYIVHCFGCFITESDVWICMELMGSCFDKLVKRLQTPVPESILGKVTVATVNALHYLKEVHRVIHRDVKPSNILIDDKGNVKLCDFGISGRLVDSKAKSKNAGCAAYMSPERINPPDPTKPLYDIRADVWSLGITLVELATGAFPYADCMCDFEVLSRVLKDDPPSLPQDGHFSLEFRDFVSLCLTKDYRLRPKYGQLLKHPFLKRYEHQPVDVALWFRQAVSQPATPRSRPVLLQSEVKPVNSNYKDDSAGCLASSKPPSRQEWEKIKGIWNTLVKRPLQRVRRKSKEEEAVNRTKVATRDLPASPLVLQRFIHQQTQRLSQQAFRDPTSSPLTSRWDRRPGGVNGYQRTEDWRSQYEGRWAELSWPDRWEGLSRGSRTGRHHSVAPQAPDSPLPPPRINKMVSPLLARRIAFNNQSLSHHAPLFLDSPFLSRRATSRGSCSVPCSPQLPRNSYHHPQLYSSQFH